MWFCMILYDFICGACGHEFETLVKSNGEDTEFIPCTECELGTAERQIGSTLQWSNNPATKGEMLKKRSFEHTKREQKSGNMLSPRDFGDK